MMLAAVKTVTKADPVWESRRHNSDVAAQATAGESVHAASPQKSSGRNGYNEQHCHCNCPLRAGNDLSLLTQFCAALGSARMQGALSASSRAHGTKLMLEDIAA